MRWRELEDVQVPVKIKLSLLWAALMGLYIYNDYFVLYLPGTIDGMSAGQMGPMGPATDLVLVGMSMMLAVPALMIFLSAVLPPPVNRWLNVVLGAVYTVLQALTMIGAAPFYQIVVVLEIMITLSIIWIALRWPRLTHL